MPEAVDREPAVAGDPRRLLAWLKRDVWPLWLARGVDRRIGGFHESLDPADLGCPAAFRRLRVLARQTYSFSRAALLGVGGAAEAAEMGASLLRATRGPDGGHPWRFDLDNRPVDEARDLYDHAFVLLAFAHAARLPGLGGLAGEARATAAFIEGALRHERSGFREGLPSPPRRRQNPHMHLLEAALAAHATFGGPPYLGLARELVALAVGELFQAREGALPEYFDDGWRPERREGRFLVEPGHHYEWAWLLERAEAAGAGCPGAGRMRDGLLAFADRHGVDPATGLVWDELESDGALRCPGFRLWPQTERLKVELGRAGGGPAASALGRMIAGAPAGLWHERLDGRGAPRPGPVPASSLYHLACALTEA